METPFEDMQTKEADLLSREIIKLFVLSIGNRMSRTELSTGQGPNGSRRLEEQGTGRGASGAKLTSG
jgi:hypothetical protein